MKKNSRSASDVGRRRSKPRSASWLSNIYANMRTDSTSIVGNGNYAIIEIIRELDGSEQRTPKFFGFQTAEDALEYAKFSRQQRLSEPNRFNYPIDPEDREHAKAHMREKAGRVEAVLRYEVVHINTPILNAELDAIFGDL